MVSQEPLIVQSRIGKFRSRLAVLALLSVFLGAGQARSQAAEKAVASTAVSDSQSPCPSATPRAMALPFRGQPESDGFPSAAAWNVLPAASFCSDWQGQNADPGRQTDVRVLWSNDMLYLRFQAHYRELNLYPTKNRRQDRLWLRDVAEAFLQPPSHEPGYKEIEVSPNGDWLAIGVISAIEAKAAKLKCELKSKGEVDEAEHTWVGELAIPMKCLTPRFDPALSWRVNFFRIEGPTGKEHRGSREFHRFYSAWRPTNTQWPFFHVPEAFGELKFASQ